MPSPLFRITIVKAYNNIEWSNDWLTIDATMADAATRAAQLVTFERNLHLTVVNFLYYRVSTTLIGDRSFRHTGINAPGLRGASGEPLPLYCTVRMDMPTADSDPARKYFRLPVQETEQSTALLLGTTVTALQNIVQTHLITSGAISGIVTSKGNPVTGATIAALVQMRQLRRKKRPAV